MNTNLLSKYLTKTKLVTLSISPNNFSRSKSQSHEKIVKKFSYFEEKKKKNSSAKQEKQQPTKVFSNSRNNYHNSVKLEEVQQLVKFVDYPEFDIIKEGQTIITIQSFFNKDSVLVQRNEESGDRFEEKILEIKDNILKRYPFIDIVMKSEIDPKDEILYPNGLFEIQLCSYNNSEILKKVIYSKQLMKYLPNVHTVIANIAQCLRSCTLTIKLHNLHKDINIIGESESLSLQNIAVQIKQKDIGYSEYQLNSQQKVFEETLSSSFFDKVSLQSVSNLASKVPSSCTNKSYISKNIKLFLQPSTTKYQNSSNISFLNGSTIFTNSSYFQSRSSIKSQKFTSHNSRQNSADKILISSMSAKKLSDPVELFSQKGLTNENGTILFKDLIYDNGQYEICIREQGQLKRVRKIVNLKEMIEQQKTTNLFLNIYLEREDFTKGEIIVKQGSAIINDAQVIIADYNFIKKEQPKPNQWKLQLFNDSITSKYVFNVKPDSYFIEISRQGSVTQSKYVHLKKGQIQLEFELQPKILASFAFRVQNLLTKQVVPNVRLKIINIQSSSNNSQNEIVCSGTTNIQGNLVCKLHLDTQFRVFAESQGFITMHYDLDVNSSHVGNEQSFTILMIPTKPLNSNQILREIIIHIPSRDFKVNFAMKNLVNNEVYDSNNKNNLYDEITIAQERFIGFSLDNINDIKFELWAFSDIKAPNIKQQVLTNKFNQLNLNESNNNKTNMFCKSVQNCSNMFLKKRVEQTVNQHKYNGKEYLYINEQLKMFPLEKSIKAYIIENNILQDVVYINVNLLVKPMLICSFDKELKIYQSNKKEYDDQHTISQILHCELEKENKFLTKIPSSLKKQKNQLY